MNGSINILTMSCIAITCKGTKCKRYATSVNEMCTFHHNKSIKQSENVIIPDEVLKVGNCIGVTTKGKLCKNKNDGCSNYCWRHKKDIAVNPCKQITKSGFNCKNNEYEYGKGICGLHNNKNNNSCCAYTHIYQNNPEVYDIDYNQSDYILTKCDKVTIHNKKYCNSHAHKFRLDKEDDCPVCMEVICSNTEEPLSCGHWIHSKCLLGWKKDTCPVCRASMTDDEVERYNYGNYRNIHNKLTVYRRFFHNIGNVLYNIQHQMVGRDVCDILDDASGDLLYISSVLEGVTSLKLREVLLIDTHDIRRRQYN
jgi:hypothetical protein